MKWTYNSLKKTSRNSKKQLTNVNVVLNKIQFYIHFNSMKILIFITSLSSNWNPSNRFWKNKQRYGNSKINTKILKSKI